MGKIGAGVTGAGNDGTIAGSSGGGLSPPNFHKYYTGYRQESGKRFWVPIENILNLLFPNEPNALYSFLNGGKRTGMKHILACVMLMPVGVLVVLVTWAWKTSGTIEVTARKKQTTRHSHSET